MSILHSLIKIRVDRFSKSFELDTLEVSFFCILPGPVCKLLYPPLYPTTNPKEIKGDLTTFPLLCLTNRRKSGEMFWRENGWGKKWENGKLSGPPGGGEMGV